MTKQEKLAVKSSLLRIKDSLFRDAWEDIVEEHPYVLQDDDDIEDDILIPEELIITNAGQDPVYIGKLSMKRKSELARGNAKLNVAVDNIKEAYGVTFQLIHGVAEGHEESIGFYVNSKQAFYRPYSSYDGAISFAADDNEAAYLRSLGYVSLKELKDVDSN